MARKKNNIIETIRSFAADPIRHNPAVTSTLSLGPEECDHILAAIDASPDAELLAIVRELAKENPIETYWIGGDDLERCHYCEPAWGRWPGQPNGPVRVDGYDHAPDCLWLRARAEAQEGEK
jgi:hypothetical protein